ncbi:unnamed protein product [Albugo candida]|uniref:Uncharacterized protein n=1 Tax=Albugo candida TaxID=65357 RepID=A0A024GNJ8_9STRA|nr:unnamed protein product [Albugo candida]|eukprot:CCI48439.1 unnamed protein product [Albugo candida]
MNSRQTTTNSRLKPANMRRVGGGYVPIQEQPHQRARPANSATVSTELQRLRKENESLKREIGHLRASKAQSESAFARQNDALVELTEMNQILKMRLQQQATEVAEQKDCIDKLSSQLKTTLSELEDRKINLTKVQTEYQNAVRLLGDHHQQLQQVSANNTIVSERPDTQTDDESSPTFFKKLNRALRLENDELHRKVDECLVEHLQRQIQQLQQLLASKKQTINVGSRNS